MSKLQLIETRTGRRTVRWRSVLLFMTVMLACYALVDVGVDWLWSALDSSHERAGWASRIASGGYIATITAAVFVYLAWRRTPAPPTNGNATAA